MHSALPVLAASLLSAATLAGQTATSANARATTPSTANTAAADTRDARLARADLARIRGRADAPVWIVVISDFQCPYCKRWHDETAPRIERTYVATGRARIAYLNFPITSHRNAQPAHEVAMCAAEQDRFWPMADALFATQDAWKRLTTPLAYFDSLASTLPVDRAALRACLARGEQRALIKTDYDRSVRLGIGATPTFLIDGRAISGAQPYEVFATAIDSALTMAARRAAPNRR